MFARCQMPGLAILILVVTFCPGVNPVTCNWDDVGSDQPFSATGHWAYPEPSELRRTKSRLIYGDIHWRCTTSTSEDRSWFEREKWLSNKSCVKIGPCNRKFTQPTILYDPPLPDATLVTPPKVLKMNGTAVLASIRRVVEIAHVDLGW